MSDDVNWIEYAADKAWVLFVAAASGFLYYVRMIIRHQERIQALEKGQSETFAELKALDAKIVAHQAERTRQIEALNLKLDTQTETLSERIIASSNETRADIRMITAKLLDKVPGS